MLIEDLNAEPSETSVTGFCKIYNLTNSIKKNDLMVSERSECFQDFMFTEIALSDFHKMTVNGNKNVLLLNKCFLQFTTFNLKSFSKSFHQQNVPLKTPQKLMNITLEKYAA